MDLYKKFIKEEITKDGCLKDISFFDYENYNFGYDVIDYYGKKTPDKTALLWISHDLKEKKFSFADIMHMSNQVANYFLSLGIKKGDRVLVVLRRHYNFWMAMIALHKIGAVAVPATIQLKKKDLVYRIKEADINAIICVSTEECIEEAELAISDLKKDIIKISSDGSRNGWHNIEDAYRDCSTKLTIDPNRMPKSYEPMLMFFTSGTTAYPKIAEHAHTYSLAHFVTAKWWHDIKENDIHLTVAETGWGKAAWGKLYGQWIIGACVFAFDFKKFDYVELLKLIEKYKVTTFCAPPTIYRFLIKADLSQFDLSSLRYLTTAGEALNPEVVTRIKEALGLEIKEGFGQTETTLTVANLINMPVKVSSMGKPTPNYSISLLDSDGNKVQPGVVGEICISLKTGIPIGLFSEYYKNPSETVRVMHDGFYHTGDMAWQDEDGYLYFVGRTDEIIKSSGYRISPFEIESVLMEHKAVLECAVIGIPDLTRGQVVKAFIVPAKGYSPSEELKKEIQNFVKSSTAPYKYPRQIDFVEDLPKTISGKIIRNKLKEV